MSEGPKARPERRVPGERWRPTARPEPDTIRVRLPGLVDSYTNGAREVELPVPGSATVATVFAALDARYPGLRFRFVDEQGAIRPHVKIFVDAAVVRDLAATIRRGSELMIVGALSGG